MAPLGENQTEELGAPEVSRSCKLRHVIMSRPSSIIVSTSIVYNIYYLPLDNLSPK